MSCNSFRSSGSWACYNCLPLSFEILELTRSAWIHRAGSSIAALLALILVTLLSTSSLLMITIFITQHSMARHGKLCVERRQIMLECLSELPCFFLAVRSHEPEFQETGTYNAATAFPVLCNQMNNNSRWGQASETCSTVHKYLCGISSSYSNYPFLALELPLLWTLLQESLALGAACCLPLLLNLLLFFYASMQANSTVILLQIFAQWTQKQNPCSCTQGTENFSVWKVTGWRLLLCRLKFRFSLLVHLTSLWKQFTLGACYLNW